MNETHREERDEPEGLDAALHQVFGGDGSHTDRSVLGRLDPEQRVLSRILLREPDGDTEQVLRPGAPDVPSRTLDRYQVMGEIARGGVGVILKGHDTDLGRDVAVKMLREEHRSREEILQRFVEEAQIGGQLQHPGIVPVYDLGLGDDGRPYFTMKLVKGRTLADLLTEREGPAKERRRFLQIFEATCQTVAYAHARGVIHRDLKPANVMVGAFGEVLVVDWGMGKVLSRGGVADERKAQRAAEPERSVIHTVRSEGPGSQSLVGSVMGTPRYMPPEQATGNIEEVGARSDVFSLGAILCELLTGQTPYQGSEPEILQQAIRGQVQGAMERLDGCGADPALIELAKACLAPAPAARPRDAAAVAAEVTAHLASLDEKAMAAQLEAAAATVKAEEERRRRRLSVALAASVAGLVILAAGGWGWWQADRQRRSNEIVRSVDSVLAEASRLRTEAAGVEGGAGVGLYEQALTLARQARNMASSADDDGTAATRSDVLVADLETDWDAARARDVQRARDAAMVDRLEAVRTEFAHSWSYAEAVAGYEESFRPYLGMADGELDTASAAERVRSSDIHEELVLALDDWRSKILEGGPTKRRLRALLDAADADPWRARLREAEGDREALLALVAESDASALPVQSLLQLVLHLESVRENERARDVARSAWNRFPGHFMACALAGQTSLSAVPPDVVAAIRYYSCAVAARPDSSAGLSQLGFALSEDGRHDEAIAACRRAVELAPNSALAHLHLGVALSDAGMHEEALAANRRSIQIDGRNAMAHNNLGVVLHQRDQFSDAEAAYRAALQIDPRHALALSNLGMLRIQQGGTEEGIGLTREAIRHDPRLVDAHSNLCAALKRLGQYEEAIRAGREAVRLDPMHVDAHVNLAGVYSLLGDHAEALRLADRAVALAPQSAGTHVARGGALWGLGRYEEADAANEEAIRLDPGHMHAHRNRGLGYKERGDLERAIACLREAVRLDPESLEAHVDLGILLERHGDVNGALEAYRISIDLNPEDARAYVNLGNLLREMGDLPAALTACEKGVALAPDKVEAWVNLTAVLNELKHVERAVQAGQRAVALDPDGEAAIQNCVIALRLADRPQEALELCRRGLTLHPESVGLLHGLGTVLLHLARTTEAVVALRRAEELEPGHPNTQLNLGIALHQVGRLEEAHALLTDVLRRRPDLVTAHAALGSVLHSMKRYAEAVASFHRYLDLVPDDPDVLVRLASSCFRLGQAEEAARLCEQAIRLNPEGAKTHAILGHALQEAGNAKGALAAYREAARLAPENASYHYNLGIMLARLGRREEAMASYRRTLALDPNHAEAHCNLAGQLGQGGEYEAALEHYRTGHELGSQRPGWKYPSEGWVRQAERMVQLAAMLDAVLEGRAEPEDAADAVALANMAYGRSSYATAARMMAAAFEASPATAEDLRAAHRYNGACAAALAGSGQGAVADTLDDEARASWRDQARRWLEADLEAWGERPTSDAALVVRTLIHWKQDTDLTGIRDADALADLTEEERAACLALWEAVEALIERARESSSAR